MPIASGADTPSLPSRSAGPQERQTAGYHHHHAGLAQANTATDSSRHAPPPQVLEVSGAGDAGATFYMQATQAPYATALSDSLSILSKDGSLTNALPGSPAAAKVDETGNCVWARQPSRSAC
jgi:hypothetical protein